MPRRGTIEKLGLEDFVLALWDDYSASQIRERIKVEHGHKVTEAMIRGFLRRAREGKVPQAQQMKRNPARQDYRDEVEALFEEAVEMKNLILERARAEEDSTEFRQLLKGFGRLAKKICDNAKLLAELDGRVSSKVPSPSVGPAESISAEDLQRAYDEAMGKPEASGKG